MDKHAVNIKNRLSLRPPQTESLKILAQIADILPLKKNADLATEQEKVLDYTGELATENGSARVFTDFERNFPCICFALATGVGKLPRFKRLSEYIGQSYFDHLANLDDLVILMDESHHYRAERGMQVINELNPILGIELTATPKTEAGGTKQFKNVVYQYGLGTAMEDGFVKEPAVATRKDFDPAKYSLEELDRIKLEDGIRIWRGRERLRGKS